MFTRPRIAEALLTVFVASALLFQSAGVVHAQNAVHPVAGSGIVQVRSAYSVPETVARIKADVASKGIRFFDEIDQARLAGDAGTLRVVTK